MFGLPVVLECNILYEYEYAEAAAGGTYGYTRAVWGL